MLYALTLGDGLGVGRLVGNFVGLFVGYFGRNKAIQGAY